MDIITLSTDWGWKDLSVARIKGAIYSEMVEVQVVDITHDISPFYIEKTVYIIKNVYSAFPKESIHLIGVYTDIRLHKKYIIVPFDGYYFVCSDNGLLVLMYSEYQSEKAIALETPQDKATEDASVKIMFAKVACHLLRGSKFKVIGRSIDRFESPITFKPQIN
ncbi:MAG: SAM-dependent chlorinase/fluorinase [Flavobacteriales bacterium]